MPHKPNRRLNWPWNQAQITPVKRTKVSFVTLKPTQKALNTTSPYETTFSLATLVLPPLLAPRPSTITQRLTRSIGAIHTRLHNGARIELPAPHKPPKQRKSQDARQIHNSVVHRVRFHRQSRGHDKDNTHKRGPDTRPRINENTRASHVPRAGLELAKEHFAGDGHDVAPV